ncbi:M12 family metallopeptidase [Flavobacterium sp. FlaQc-48]|uniref:M12 family metallopeptidase n=1 Tax=Flavobacterium sp. FlaQc-48 TaxID=3374181 RepID=UPI0037563AE1
MKQVEAEFTLFVRDGNWTSVRTALKQNWKNNKLELLTEQETFLERFLVDPYYLPNKESIDLLTEMAIHTSKMWNDGQTLNIYFMDGTNENKEQVKLYASEWCNHCSLKFNFNSSLDNSDIRISFMQQGCWSYIGTDCKANEVINKPTMNFGWLGQLTTDNEKKGIILHEFGHALGLIHEHQSPAIKIDWAYSYVYMYYATFYNWTIQDVNWNVFHEFTTSTIKNTPIDVNSIMAYHIPPEFTTNNIQFPKNLVLSDIDKQTIGQFYK